MQVLRMLRAEHARIRGMLTCFEDELDRFKRNEAPDYNILESSIEYCGLYLNRWHHPVEDALFERLLQRAPDVAVDHKTLVAQHIWIARISRELAESFAAVCRGTPLRRDKLTAMGSRLITTYRNHLRLEETQFYSATAQTLIGADWQAIERRFADRIDSHRLSSERYLPLLNVINRTSCPCDGS